MSTAARILTWSAMTAAGLDTERVERGSGIEPPDDDSIEEERADSRDGELRQWTGFSPVFRYSYRADSRDGELRLVFGEYYDRDGGAWSASEYRRSEGGWDFVGEPYWYETPDALLVVVKAWLDED